MGYMSVNPAASLNFGIPKQTQTLFLVESAMNLLLVEIVPKVREILSTMDDIETRIAKAPRYLVAQRLGEMTLRDDHPDLLEQEYCRWANRLSDCLGAPLYPFAERFKRGSAVTAGSIPVRR